MQRKFYCSLATLEKLVLDNVAPEVRSLLSRHDTLVLDISEQQLDEELASSDSILQPLLKSEANGLTLDTQPECLNDPEVLLRAEAAGAMVLLDRSPEECRLLEQQFGVCVLSLAQLQPAATLTAYFYRQIEKDVDYRRSQGQQDLMAWGDVLADKPDLPLNALVVIDNYLLKDREAGFESTTNLLEALLPVGLSRALPFEVLLVVSAQNHQHLHRIDVLEELAARLEKRLNRPYPVRVGILTHNNDGRFHRRVVVSNYHFLRSDRGFAQFVGSRAAKPNDLSLSGAYHDLTRPGNDLMWKSMAVELRNVSLLKNSNKQLKEAGRDTIITTNRMGGHCDNRLLTLVQ